MKTHSHYTTPTATTAWVRSSATVLAALLILAATFALLYAVRSFHNSTLVVPAAPARPAAIGSCRACQDEWIGAMQQSRVTFAPAFAGSELRQAVPALVLSARRQPVASRVFRDELQGADQANLAWLVAPSAPVRSSSRTHGLVPRVFQDEVLGADQANLGSITLPGGVVFESQPDQLRKSGPR
jgi:hypothetical protein